MNPVLLWFHQLGSPSTFHAFSGRWAPWLLLAAMPMLAYGIYAGLFVVPPDYQQGDSYRILFVHEVPVGNIVGLEGRIRCADTREFDFKRDHANEKFTIRLCEPTVC